MARAIALARTLPVSTQDYARIAITTFCAVALIAAGRFLPF
jgi:hypothetical protein